MEEKHITLFKFNCTRCNRKAESVKKDKAEVGLCRTCRSLKIAPGQLEIL